MEDKHLRNMGLLLSVVLILIVVVFMIITTMMALKSRPKYKEHIDTHMAFVSDVVQKEPLI